MKNIAILLFFTLLLTSCGKAVEKTENETNENNKVTQETSSSTSDLTNKEEDQSSNETTIKTNEETSVNGVENVIALMKTNF
jgi:hypothetical protein